MTVSPEQILARIHDGEPRAIARAITLVEDNDPTAAAILAGLDATRLDRAFVLGITGPPGAGKSTLTSRLITHFRERGERLGIIAIDPTSPVSGGAFLGDRIRMMRHAVDKDVVVRSMATRGRLGGLCSAAADAVRIMASSGCTKIIIETVGVGQSEMDIIRFADSTVLVLSPGLGDDIQAMKAGILEVADILVVNKADVPGADALAMELEGAVRMRTGQGANPEILKTSAAQGNGITKLAGVIDRVNQEQRQSGVREARRANALEREVLDRALELIRPGISRAVKTAVVDGNCDARRCALEILKKMGIKIDE